MNVRVLGNDVFADCHYLTQAEIEGTERQEKGYLHAVNLCKRLKLGYG